MKTYGGVDVYVVCSKSIEPSSFPRKPMKSGRLPSVEMWRGHYQGDYFEGD
jgi:hypothetical protein